MRAAAIFVLRGHDGRVLVQMSIALAAGAFESATAATTTCTSRARETSFARFIHESSTDRTRRLDREQRTSVLGQTVVNERGLSLTARVLLVLIVKLTVRAAV